MLQLSYLFLESGDLVEAEYQANRALELAESLGHAIGRAMMMLVLVWVAIDRGEFEHAHELLGKCFAVASEAGYQGLMAYCVAAEAGLAAATGEPERAVRRLGSLRAERVLDAIGGEGGRAIGLRLRALQHRLAGELGEDRFGALMSEGEQLRLNQLAPQPH
jgi:hypothetical protein